MKQAFSLMKPNKITLCNQLADENAMSILQLNTSITPDLKFLASAVQAKQSHP
jgi:hypothetical protein